ncbi:MAG: SIMPL domain-containing protein [Candidatus Veblenbacteria bacterium]|nr:SIMPL domain-containing protein [Candidatus Veblenbacteria bacterium]
MNDFGASTQGASVWRQPKTVLVLVGIVLLAGVVTVSILRDRIVSQPQWQVNVVGQGKVSYQPDTAEVTIGVQVDRAHSAELAMRQLSEKMDKIVAAIKAADVPAEDITTQNFSLSPQYDYRDGVQTSGGYSANQQVIVKVKDLNNSKEKLAKVIGEATKAGANQIVGVNFSVSNIEELKQQARVEAILDAKGKAGSLAEAADVRLGKVIGWWENVVQAPGAPYYGERAMGIGGAGGGSTPTVPAGEQEIVVEVTVNYKVK